MTTTSTTASCTASTNTPTKAGIASTGGGGDPPPHVGSPGERWCDVDHRVKRCSRQRCLLVDPEKQWSIDEAVTENLDLRELLADYCSLLATADECQTAFDVLSSLTVCDPTAGSGAFLFAALDVLQPLYETVLARAAEIHDAREPGHAPAAFLAQADAHHSRRHWIIKTICLRNLYGVDLMAEAPEIAKLRLFLKLAAQIEHLDDIEPLPDLDFNIKTGNLLVGIASIDDAKARFGKDNVLITDEQKAKLETLADDVAEAQDEFIAAQSQDTGDTDLSEAKEQMTARLQAARSEANRLLYELRVEQKPPDEWVASHQPFHWFLEFPGVWRDGGFDVILGNPPYLEAKKVKRHYRWQGYKTQDCRDLYALCTERASRLLNRQGRMAMIVMHSLCFSRNFHALREHLVRAFPTLWVSAYDKRPDSLFAGSAQVRNSIVIGAKHRRAGLHTSACHRWLSQCRGYVFANVSYLQPGSALLSVAGKSVWPFVDSLDVVAAFAKMSNHKPVGDSLAVGVAQGHRLYFKNVAHYMLGAYVDQPPIVTLDGMTSTSPHDRVMAFKSETQRDVALMMYSGRWGYLWWLIFSDQFNVTRSTLAAFPGDIETLCGPSRREESPKPATSDMELINSLVELSRELQQEMPNHLAWQQNAGVRVGRYNMAALRHITDEADLLLAKLWGIEDAYEAAGNLRDRMIFGNKA